jgi:hypothetical protein
MVTELYMQMTHDGPPPCGAERHNRAANRADVPASLLGNTDMLLSFITAFFRAKPAFVWQPALTLTDSRIVSELTGAAN